jgi:hypothetical protein
VSDRNNNSTVALMLMEEDDITKFRQWKKEAEMIVATATAGPLATIEERANLVATMGRGAIANRELENLRHKIVDPMNAEVRAINALFNEATDLLDALRVRGGQRLKAFDQEQKAAYDRNWQEALRRQEEAARKEAEAQARADATSDPVQRQEALAQAEAASREQTAAYLDTPREPAKHVRTEDGSAIQKRKWTFEIVDAALVPRTFCTPDLDHIRAAVKAGVREIAGVNIYEDVNYAITTR